MLDKFEDRRGRNANTGRENLNLIETSFECDWKGNSLKMVWIKATVSENAHIYVPEMNVDQNGENQLFVPTYNVKRPLPHAFTESKQVFFANLTWSVAAKPNKKNPLEYWVNIQLMSAKLLDDATGTIPSMDEAKANKTMSRAISCFRSGKNDNAPVTSFFNDAMNVLKPGPPINFTNVTIIPGASMGDTEYYKKVIAQTCKEEIDGEIRAKNEVNEHQYFSQNAMFEAYHDSQQHTAPQMSNLMLPKATLQSNVPQQFQQQRQLQQRPRRQFQQQQHMQQQQQQQQFHPQDQQQQQQFHPQDQHQQQQFHPQDQQFPPQDQHQQQHTQQGVQHNNELTFMNLDTIATHLTQIDYDTMCDPTSSDFTDITAIHKRLSDVYRQSNDDSVK